MDRLVWVDKRTAESDAALIAEFVDDHCDIKISNSLPDQTTNLSTEPNINVMKHAQRRTFGYAPLAALSPLAEEGWGDNQPLACCLLATWWSG